jgi:hypothetical protein
LTVIALRMRVNISAMGSVIMVVGLSLYQLDLRTPGISPWSASFRKQMRQIPNFRYTALDRPHSLQRRFRRVENFGSRRAMANFDLLATDVYLFPGGDSKNEGRSAAPHRPPISPPNYPHA